MNPLFLNRSSSHCKSQPSRSLSVTALLAALLLMTSVVACGPGSPEEKVTQTRAQYSVQLNSWFPKIEEPVAEPEAEMGEDMAAEAASDDAPAEGEAAEGETMDAEEAGMADSEPAAPSTTTIFFDLIVLFSGQEPLPGITVDITHADADGNEKGTWRRFLDIPNIVKSETKQIDFEDDREFVEGDQFSVQLLKQVDPANYSEYSEYASAQ